MRRYLLSCVRGESLWRYELFGRSEDAYGLAEICVVETAAGAPVGLLVHARELWFGDLNVLLYELEEETSWSEATPSAVRYLRRTGDGYAARDGSVSLRDVMFTLSTEHPVYGAIEDSTPHWERPRAWYVRIDDVPGFIRHVSPVLERRLVASGAAGHTGELSIGFIDYGVDLSLENGRLQRVERRATPARGDSWLDRGSSDALFPGLTFLTRILHGPRHTHVHQPTSTLSLGGRSAFTLR